MKKNILLFGLALFSSVLEAAEPATASDYAGWTTPDYIKQTTPWLLSNNAAGLDHLKAKTISEASIFFNKGNGGWVNYNESDNSFEAGIKAESFYRINPNVVLTGQIDYSYFQGKNMGGSYLIDPYNSPFNLVDCNENNRGKKRKEVYHIMGGVSGRIHENWILGGKFDYSATNFAKQKDLRHTNHLMNLIISPAVIFEANKHFSLGLDYTYQRKNEGITFQTFGTTDQIYNSIISYGAFWGTKEEFGTNGYTKGNEDKPLFDEFHQGHFQIDWDIDRQLNFFNETGYQRRTGHYGVQSPNTIVHSNHNAHIVTNSTTLTVDCQHNRHFVNVDFAWEQLNNFENIYRHENEGGGLQNIGYYGKLQTVYRKSWNLGIDYTLHLGLRHHLPQWIIKGGYNAHKRMIRASYYPYYRIQELNTNTFNLGAQYHLYSGKNQYRFQLSAEYAYGKGDKAHDGAYTSDKEEQQNTLYTEDSLLNKEFEYITAKQMRYNIEAKYARQIKHTKMVGFCTINYIFAFAPNKQYIEGNQHHIVSIAVGCNF